MNISNRMFLDGRQQCVDKESSRYRRGVRELVLSLSSRIWIGVPVPASMTNAVRCTQEKLLT
jgi:hypothetical protein